MRLALALLAVSGLGAQTFNSGKLSYALPSASTFTLTGATVPAGSTVWVMFGTSDSCYGSTFTVSDAGGNTYTQIGTANSRTYACSAQFYARNVNGFSGSITVDPSVGFSAGIVGYAAITGADTSAPLDAYAIGGSIASPAVTGSITTTANTVIVSGTVNYYPSGTYTPGAGFTLPAGGTAGGTGGTGAIEYLSATPGTFTPSFTVTGSVYTASVAAAFKVAGSSGAPTVRKRVEISQ